MHPSESIEQGPLSSTKTAGAAGLGGSGAGGDGEGGDGEGGGGRGGGGGGGYVTASQ